MSTGRTFWKRVAIIVPAIVALFGCIAAFLKEDAIWDFILQPTTTPTFTPAIVISQIPSPFETSIPSSTPEFPCTFSASCKAGEDWASDCISSKLWVIYPPSQIPMDGLGCYKTTTIWDSISIKDGGLAIFAQPKAMVSAKEFGVFTKLPTRGRVTECRFGYVG